MIRYIYLPKGASWEELHFDYDMVEEGSYKEAYAKATQRAEELLGEIQEEEMFKDGLTFEICLEVNVA